MNHSFQPVTVTTHTGSVYEPMSATIDGGTLTVSDRDGTTIATATTTDGVRGGRRRRTVETTEGRWLIEDICGCGSQKRALLRYWRHKE